MDFVIYAMFGGLAIMVGILLANIQLKNEGVSKNTVIVTTPSNKDNGSENDDSGSGKFWLKVFIVVLMIVAVVLGSVIIDYLIQHPSNVLIPIG